MLHGNSKDRPVRRVTKLMWPLDVTAMCGIGEGKTISK
jgi:hypothetical protein